MAPKPHSGHRYMTSEERAHKRYGKTTKTHHTGAPPPPAAADAMPSGGAPPSPAVPAQAAGPSPADAIQAQAAGAMGMPQGTSGMNNG